MTDEAERLDDDGESEQRLDETDRLEEGDDGFRRSWTFEAEPGRTADVRAVSRDATRIDAALRTAEGDEELFASDTAGTQVSGRVTLPDGEEEFELTVVDVEGVSDPPRVSVAVIEE